jgi:prevent-host-death family protein
MATVVRVQQAKTHLSGLLAEVEAGGEIIIARGDLPVARLVPIDPAGPRPMGFVANGVPDTFFEPLPDDELDAWEA